MVAGMDTKFTNFELGGRLQKARDVDFAPQTRDSFKLSRPKVGWLAFTLLAPRRIRGRCMATDRIA